MPTLLQLTKKPRKIRRKKNRRPALKKCPQKKAICLKVFEMTPRKPNSAIRKVAWIVVSNKKRVHAYIPGMFGNDLQKHSVVLIRGGSVKDLPGMKYTIIRGKFDLKPVYQYHKARSKYGVFRDKGRLLPKRYKKFRYW